MCWCHRYVQASAFIIELRKYNCRQEWKDNWWRLALTCSAGWYPLRILWVHDDAQGKASYFTNMTGVDVLTTNRWAVLNNLRLVNITITCKTWPNTTSHFSSVNTHNRRMVNIYAFLKTTIHTTISKLSKWSFHTGAYQRMTPTRRGSMRVPSDAILMNGKVAAAITQKLRVHLYHLAQVLDSQLYGQHYVVKVNHSVSGEKYPGWGKSKVERWRVLPKKMMP